MAANNINFKTAAAADNGNSNGSGSGLSPKLRSPTWNQIVRQGEYVPPQRHPIPPAGDSPRSDSLAVIESNGSASPSRVSGGEDGGAENGGGGVGGRGGFKGDAGKRPAWKKPAADGTAVVVDAVVMGAESWPALAGSTRVGKTPSLGTLKGSVDVSSSGQGLVNPSASQKQANDAVAANSSSGYSSPTLPRSNKHSGSSSSSNGILAMEQPASPGSPADSRASNPSPGDRNVMSGVLSNSHGGNEHIQQPRNSFRNRNGVTHAHGDGHHRPNFGMRRDQERRNQEWNHRNVNNNNRDSRALQQRGFQRYARSMPAGPPPPPPPLPAAAAAASFITPLPVRPYGGTIAFPDLQAPYYIYPVQSPTFYPPVTPRLMYQPSQDNIVHTRILSQIDYYFSNENLVKDTFLRQNMNEQGWVPISLIARFKKISQLTDSVQIIMDALYHSTVVEVQGDKIRRRNDWRRWIMPAVNPFPEPSTPRSSEIPNHEMVATGIRSLSLDRREMHDGSASSQLHMHADGTSGMPSGSSSIPGEMGSSDAYRDMAAVGTDW